MTKEIKKIKEIKNKIETLEEKGIELRRIYDIVLTLISEDTNNDDFLYQLYKRIKGILSQMTHNYFEYKEIYQNLLIKFYNTKVM